jgi:hypothetical protein
MIVNIIDSLSGMIRDFLIMSKLKGEINYQPYSYTKSPEAFRNYLSAQKAFLRLDMKTAIDRYLTAMSIDSNFVDAGLELSLTYGEDFQYENARIWRSGPILYTHVFMKRLLKKSNT